MKKPTIPYRSASTLCTDEWILPANIFTFSWIFFINQTNSSTRNDPSARVTKWHRPSRHVSTITLQEKYCFTSDGMNIGGTHHNG
jgi:hypothetical protein